MPDASPIDPSRHTPQSEPPSQPIPIPEAEARSRKARTVRIQDILAAHARALDVRLDEGMREMRLAMESAIRRSSIQEAPQAAPTPQPQVQAPAPAPPPPAPAPEAVAQPSLPREDLARGLAQQTEERFQSLALRLQRIEDAVRSAALAGGDSGELGSKLEALTDGMNRVASTEEDLFDRLLDAQREGLDDLTRRVGAGVAAVIRAMQTELNATITRLELTADASAAVSPGDTARLERTMMAIAEHQEAVLDDRLTELRESMVDSFQQTEETAAEVAALDLDEKTAPEGPRIGVEEAFPWPEPVPEEPLADETVADDEVSTPETLTENGEASEEAPEAQKAEVDETSESQQPAVEDSSSEAEPEPEVAETSDRQDPPVGEATATEEESGAQEEPAPKKRRRRKRRKTATKD
ncbi:MAG: hypothetical protein ACRDHM_07615 [Actinomycetota bacterium]